MTLQLSPHSAALELLRRSERYGFHPGSKTSSHSFASPSVASQTPVGGDAPIRLPCNAGGGVVSKATPSARTTSRVMVKPAA